MSDRRFAAIESLESRRLLAATAVSNGQGLLMITGTEEAESIIIEASGSELVVRQADGVDWLTLYSGNKWDTRSLYVDLKGGNDSLAIHAVETGLGGTIDAGEGDDAVSITNSSLATLLVRTDAGSDRVFAGLNTFENLIVETGDDADRVEILGNRVWGYASVDLGGGNDRLVVLGNTVYGFTYINGGEGNDTFIGLTLNKFEGGSYIPGFEII